MFRAWPTLSVLFLIKILLAFLTVEGAIRCSVSRGIRRANDPWLIRVRLLKLRGEQTLRDGARELRSYFVIFPILLLNNWYLTLAVRLASITNIPTSVPSVFFGCLMDKVKGSGTVAVLKDNTRPKACILYGDESGPSSATVSASMIINYAHTGLVIFMEVLIR